MSNFAPEHLGTVGSINVNNGEWWVTAKSIATVRVWYSDLCDGWTLTIATVGGHQRPIYYGSRYDMATDAAEYLNALIAHHKGAQTQ